MLLRWIPRVRAIFVLFMTPVLLIACATTLQVQTPTPGAASSPAPIVQSYTFTGSATRAVPFVQNLAPDLTFQLIPIQAGWEIWVGDSMLSTEATYNFAMPVTLPFTGINARHLEGWHFRNRDNSGPNEAGAKNVNAPQALRPFCFVADRASFQAARDALAAGPPALAGAVAEDAFPIHSGTLTITNYLLGNLAPNQRAWLEQIDFTVTLNLDQPCDLF